MITMYENYELFIKKYAAILRTAFIALGVIVMVVLLALGFVFGIGVAFGDVNCASVTYGESVEPSLSASVSKDFEYRLLDDKNATFQKEKPRNAGRYEVRAYTVSPIGIRRYAGRTEFEIRPAKLTVTVPGKEDYAPIEEITVDPSECTVTGLKYGDTVGEPVLEYSYLGKTGTVMPVSVEVFHKDGSSAQNCYTYTFQAGTIRDVRVDLTVKAGSKRVQYNGNPNVTVSEEQYQLQGSLMTGHTAHFRCVGEQVGIGVCPNEIDPKTVLITDEKGQDVTYMYVINCVNGQLEFAKRKITITSDSASKEYDGIPLTKHSCKISGDGLAADDRLEMDYIGMQLLPGKSPNEFENILIMNRTFGDVTYCYDITTRFGTLKVTAPSSNGEPDDDDYESPNEEEFNMDRDSLPFEGIADGTYQSATPVFEYYGLESGRTYFRQTTYGVYTGSGFRKTPGEDAFGTYGNYLTGNVLKENGRTARRIYIRNNKLDKEVYPYYMREDPKRPEEGKGFAYDYCCEVYSMPSKNYPVSLSDEEQEYAAFVRENYMDVPADVSRVLRELGQAAGISESDEDLIQEIADYIAGAANYNLSFAPFPANEDMVIYFLTKSKEGICQHYAAAATLMYREYGIPARFVVGLAPEGYKGTWNKALPGDGHAWTEIYLDGTGWIPVEVTGASSDPSQGGGGSGFGSFEGYQEISVSEEDNPIIVDFTYYEKEYDGLPVLDINPGGEFLYGTIEPDETVVCAAETMSAPEYVGEYIFYWEAYVVDGAGNDVSDKYTIAAKNVPTIKIKQRTIEITTYGMEGGELDGRLESSGWYISKGSLASGDRIELTLDASQYEIGSSSNTPRYIHVINENGDDITDCYYIIPVSGTLKKK